MNDTTLWKIVVGANIPRPSPFSGIQGWIASTINPNTNRTLLNSSKEAVYCFQFCGPQSNFVSIQRRIGNGRYFPSMIQAKYLLNGIANRVVTTRIEIGRSHIRLKSFLIQWWLRAAWGPNIWKPIISKGQWLGKSEKTFVSSRCWFKTTPGALEQRTNRWTKAVLRSQLR